MVTMAQVERKIPLTVLESKIGELSYQLVVQSEATLESCLEALEQFKDHLIDLKKKAEDAQKTQEETQKPSEGG
jgi:hypothetical protein